MKKTMIFGLMGLLMLMSMGMVSAVPTFTDLSLYDGSFIGFEHVWPVETLGDRVYIGGDDVFGYYEPGTDSFTGISSEVGDLNDLWAWLKGLLFVGG